MTELIFKTKPYDHQREDLELTKDQPYFGIFWEMGLGKSKYALDLASYLFRKKEIDRVLFISRSGVDEQFVRESVHDHLPLDEKDYITDEWQDWSSSWPKLAKFGSTLEGKLQIAAVNCEALGTRKGPVTIEKFVRSGRTLLVVDESQEFGGIDATRTKNLLRIAPFAPYRRIMTGTPTGGNPCHLYPQMSILHPSIFPESKWGFEHRYCVKEGTKIWVKDKKTDKPVERLIQTIVGFRNITDLEKRIGHLRSRRLKDDCLDLPPKIYKPVFFDLSPEELKLYNQVKEGVLTELVKDKFVSCEMAATKLLRLQQIACGYAVFEDLVTGEKGQMLLPNPSKIKMLLSLTDRLLGKNIIWSRFTLSVDMVIEALTKRFGENAVVRYDGTVSPNLRATNKIRFKHDPDCRWLVGHPQAGGVGLDLPEASNMVYFSNDHKLITRLQSEDRAHRIGSKGAVTYYDLCANRTVDYRIVKALAERFDIASQLTGDKLREWIKL